MRAAIDRLDALAAAWSEILPTDSVRRVRDPAAARPSLRAADALQLAAATVAAEGRPDTLPVVSLDDRPLSAAEREGFALVVPSEV